MTDEAYLTKLDNLRTTIKAIIKELETEIESEEKLWRDHKTEQVPFDPSRLDALRYNVEQLENFHTNLKRLCI